MTRKACFNNFYENVSETLIEDNAGKDCFCHLLFNFEEAVIFLNSSILIKFSNLLLWIMLLKIFYLLILPKPYLREY